jgi:dipeptidase D
MAATFPVPEPETLWTHFFDLVRVPRPSKQEQAAIDHLAHWASEQGYVSRRDAVGNLAVFVPATGDAAHAKNKATVILQSHVDIVAVTLEAKEAEQSGPAENGLLADAALGRIPLERGHFDPERPKRLIQDPQGDWINSPWTTLGADNGIGVAMMMTLAESQHRPVNLQLLFTIDEEAGMTGAGNLEAEKLGLSAQWLINIDTEDDDEITVGAAGGRDVELRWSGQWSSVPAELPSNTLAYRISIQGLKGGHSGVEIHQGRANANRLLARCLGRMSEAAELMLVSLRGGQRRNAIPDACEGVFYCDAAKEETLRRIVSDSTAEWNAMFLSPASSRTFFNMLTSIPTGICEMTPEIANLVEASCNLAIVQMAAGEPGVIICSVRGTMAANLNDITESLLAIAQLSGATTRVSDGYPGWKPKLDSRLLKVAGEQYQKLFQEEAKIHAVHAGLECGLLAEKMPGLEMISIGPNIKGNHAVGERVQISSVQKSFHFLQAILDELAAGDERENGCK